MNTNLIKRICVFLLMTATAALALAACGGGTGSPAATATTAAGARLTPAATDRPTATVRPPATETPTSAPTSQPTATATPPATETATAAANPAPGYVPASTAQAGSTDGDLLAQGKLLFEKTAGGVGCAYCHGVKGDGKGIAGMGAPANRGKTEDQVRIALADVSMMAFIKLTDDEITAVVAYLQYLATQP